MRAIEHTERSLAGQLEKQQAIIRKNFEHRRAEISRELAAIAGQIDALEKRRQREFGQRLSAVQRSFVQNYLSDAELDSSRISGIGPQLVANMQAAGIRSAGDFTGVSYVQGGRFVIAYFHRKHGGRVHVPGIGQVKAQRLEQWRQSQASTAMRLQPTTLPADEARALEASFSSSIGALKDQRGEVEARVNAGLQALQPELDKAFASAADEHRLKVEALGPRKSGVGARLGQAQAEYLAARQEFLDWGTQMAAYKSWRFGRFVRTAVRGPRSS
jgi:hypothetical protein